MANTSELYPDRAGARTHLRGVRFFSDKPGLPYRAILYATTGVRHIGWFHTAEAASEAFEAWAEDALSGIGLYQLPDLIGEFKPRKPKPTQKVVAIKSKTPMKNKQVYLGYAEDTLFQIVRITPNITVDELRQKVSEIAPEGLKNFRRTLDRVRKKEAVIMEANQRLTANLGYAKKK